MNEPFTQVKEHVVPRGAVSVDVVLDAALAEFAEKGFVRARVAAVARRAKVSTGSVYNVAVSKEALFAAVFVPTAGRTDLVLPLPDPGHDRMQEVIATRLREATALPLHERALHRDRAEDIAVELHELLVERFETMAASWRQVAAVERTAADLPAVFDAFYNDGRAAFLGSLATYLRSRAAAGQLRLTAAPHLVARFVVEAIAFWAYHRNQDPTMQVSDDEARQVCVSLLLTALLHGPDLTLARAGQPA